MQKAQEVQDRQIEKDLSAIIGRYKDNPQELMHMLLTAQQASGNNFVPESTIVAVSQATGVPAAKLYGFTQFYAMFSEKKRGQYVIRMCDSASCHVCGAPDAMKEALSQLGLDRPDSTTTDGKFTVEECECLGVCDMAPAAMADGEVYGNLDAVSIKDMLADLQKGGE